MEEQRREILLKIDLKYVTRKYFQLMCKLGIIIFMASLHSQKEVPMFTISIISIPVKIVKLITKCKLFFFKTLSQSAYFVSICLYKNLYIIFLNSGTPSQETWPGVSSNDEFKNYNFPKYKPQPLINHAPRYFFCLFL